MAAVTIFYLTFCPYCIDAKRALKALQAENPAYAAVDVTWIEESRERALAEAHSDYWYVPSVYAGMDKLYEAHPSHGYEEIQAGLRAALDRALEAGG